MIAFLYAIMTVDIFYIGFSIFIFNFHNGLAVPHEYCLGPLNRSDCGVSSTPVFSYYKPGSRCEIEFWRGCPTINKFNDEFLCSHFCIGKLFGFTQTDDNEINKTEDRCSKPLDKGDCGSNPTTVYTYDGHCQPAEWRGCSSINMFRNYSDCVRNCEPSIDGWKEKIKALNAEDVEKIDDILEVVAEIAQVEDKEETAGIETATKKREKLVLNVVPEPSTEQVAEAPEEKDTEALAAGENVTEVPATEASATEAPATEASATEAPATEASATEAPATEAPATEAPATEVPATEAPATETPAIEVPAAEENVTEAPAAEEKVTEPAAAEDDDSGDASEVIVV